jgi:hypothetical protein
MLKKPTFLFISCLVLCVVIIASLLLLSYEPRLDSNVPPFTISSLLQGLSPNYIRFTSEIPGYNINIWQEAKIKEIVNTRSKNHPITHLNITLTKDIPKNSLIHFYQNEPFEAIAYNLSGNSINLQLWFSPKFLNESDESIITSNTSQLIITGIYYSTSGLQISEDEYSRIGLVNKTLNDLNQNEMLLVYMNKL